MYRFKNYAYSVINGGKEYPSIKGTVTFNQMKYGVVVTAEINGLPQKDECGDGIFAIHIHGGNSCSGDESDEFKNVGMHYNPKNCEHPYHAGDLPPLFSNGGYAYMQVLTDRFTVDEIIDKTIVIHLGTDDFKSQPSGNSGQKIACGKIVLNN